jgi:glycerophosphoryl diester phosphodiesterase
MRTAPSNRTPRLLAACLALLTVACSPAATAREPTVPPERPLVIAHRGASGYLPEHTLAAYAAGYAMGADYIEPDVVMTSDGVLICAHDLTLEDTTDVARVFPNRARRDGSWYAIDFTLEEIKRLQRTGRTGRPQMPGHAIPTLGETLELIAAMNRRTGRQVGVIPEPKDPRFHAKHRADIARALVTALKRFGYTSRSDLAVIQCFDAATLRTIRDDLGSDLRLVYLTGDALTDRDLDTLAPFCDGIGPRFTLLAAQDEDTGAWSATDLAERARERGFTLWPYTFGGDTLDTTRFLETVRVDGFFTDYPDRGVLSSIAVNESGG